LLDGEAVPRPLRQPAGGFSVPETHLAILFHGHASTRTTQFYNKLPEEISLDEIERIHI